MIDFPQRYARKYARLVFLSALFVSNLGDWFYLLTTNAMLEAAWKISLVSLAQACTTIGTGLVMTAFAERLPPRQILIWTNAISALVTCLLGWSIKADGVQFSLILMANVVLGIVNAFLLPTNEIYFKAAGPEEERFRQIWIKESNNHLGRVLVAAVLALLFISKSFSMAYLIDSLTFALMVLAMLLPDGAAVKPSFIAGSLVSPWERTKQGFYYVFKNPGLRALNFAFTFSNAFGYSIFYFSREFAGSAENYGLAMLGAGIGFVTGCYATRAFLLRYPHLIKRLFVFSTIGSTIPLIVMILGAPNPILMMIGYGLANFIGTGNYVLTKYINQSDEHSSMVLLVVTVFDRSVVHLGRAILALIAVKFLDAKSASLLGVAIALATVAILLIRNRDEMLALVKVHPPHEIEADTTAAKVA